MIPNKVFTKYKEVCDALITDLGVDFTLVYVDSNCYCTQSNIYAGPQIVNERCLYCATGQPIETKETVRFRYYNTPKHFIKTGIVPSPDSSVQIIGFLSDKDKLLRCDYLKFNNQKFKLSSNIQTHGFLHDRYFIAYLQEIL